MGRLSTLALLDAGALFLQLCPQWAAQGWAQGSRESGMLLGKAAHRPGEASPRQDDLAESACRTSQGLDIMGRPPEGGEPVLCRDCFPEAEGGDEDIPGKGKNMPEN